MGLEVTQELILPPHHRAILHTHHLLIRQMWLRRHILGLRLQLLILISSIESLLLPIRQAQSPITRDPPHLRYIPKLPDYSIVTHYRFQEFQLVGLLGNTHPRSKRLRMTPMGILNVSRQGMAAGADPLVWDDGRRGQSNLICSLTRYRKTVIWRGGLRPYDKRGQAVDNAKKRKRRTESLLVLRSICTMSIG